MDRVSRGVRRGGVKIMSGLTGGNHSDLNILISEIKDVRNGAKSFMTAQNSAAQQLLKWGANESNNHRAIQDVTSQLCEINTTWTEVQRDFNENLRDVKLTFEQILEGEKHIDAAKHQLTLCEHREAKLKKELKKVAKRATIDELNQLEDRLGQAERAKYLAHLELTERIEESEALKLIQLKQGLVQLAEAYVEMGSKCTILHEAARDIAYQLPDVLGLHGDVRGIKYTGSGATKYSVFQAKEKVSQYTRPVSSAAPPALTLPHPSEPPPPYSPPDHQFLQKMASSLNNQRNSSPSIHSIHEEDQWHDPQSAVTAVTGPHPSPETVAWQWNDLNHPHTPTEEKCGDSPKIAADSPATTIPAHLLKYLTLSPPGKLASVGGALTNRQSHVLKLKQTEQQKTKQMPLPLRSPSNCESLMSNEDEPDFDFVTALPPTTFATALNGQQQLQQLQHPLGITPLNLPAVVSSVDSRLCYILATTANAGSSPLHSSHQLAPSPSILALATPTTISNSVAPTLLQDSQVLPPPCYDSLPRTHQRGLLQQHQSVASSQTDHEIPIATGTVCLTMDGKPLNQDDQTDGLESAQCKNVPLKEDIPSQSSKGMARNSENGSPKIQTAPSGLTSSRSPDSPSSPESLALCCYSPVYIDDLEVQADWDSEIDEDELSTAMGAARIG